MSVPLTIVEQTIQSPNLAWDTTWDGFIGDFGPALPTEPSNMGGFRARAPLQTAILLCLMSDGRAGPNDPIPDGSNDPRGWAGDAIDASLAPLGSKWWLLRRRELTPEVAGLAVAYARMALQTLIAQGAVAAFDVTADAVLETGRLNVGISAYKVDGSLAAALNFSILWNESNGVFDPLSPLSPLAS